MNKFEACIKAFGGNAKAVCESTVSKGKAVILPMRYKNKMYLGIELNDYGMFDGSTYILLCTPDLVQNAINKTIITLFNTKYYVKSVNPIYFKGKIAYKWCVVVKCEEEGL